MSDKKKKFKDIHGKTRIGLWLKEKAPNLLGTILNVAGDLIPGGSAFKSVVEGLIGQSDEVTTQGREHALKLLEYDMQEMVEVTKRLQTDNEHNITRLVRPISYGAMFLLFLTCVLFDGNVGDFTIDKKYVPVIESLFWIQTTFYFGSRGLEKMMKVFKTKD